MNRHLPTAAFLAACLLTCVPAHAQNPVVLVHGGFSDGDTWAQAAARLESTLWVKTYRPNLPSTSTYEKQAEELQKQVGFLPGHTVAVGHSNGGVVSRQWSRVHPLQAVVTLSSPNAGAALARNLPAFAAYNFSAFGLILDVQAAFGLWDYAWSWVWSYVFEGASYAYDISFSTVAILGATTALDAKLPVTAQLRPDSAYWKDLNSASNLSLEASRVPVRVGIVNEAKNFYHGGIFRGLHPDWADSAHLVMAAGSYILDYWAYYLLLHVAEDDRNLDVADRLFTLSNWLASHEMVWCQTVSDFTFTYLTSKGICTENDGIVPHYTMQYPNGLWLRRTNTVTHTELTEDSATIDYIADVLKSRTQIVSIGSAPPPPGPTPPPGGYTPPASDTNSLVAGEKLAINSKITSADGRYRLTYQSDGNLVLRFSDNTPLWSSKTSGTTTKHTVMQSDGNLVIYDSASKAVWSTKTHGNAGAYTLAKNDGNVIVRMPSGTQLWQTGTTGLTGSTGSSCGSSCGSQGILGPDTQLNPGQALYSPDGKYKLGYQNDGNLVFRRVADNVALWSSGTHNTGGAGKARMQGDGNFVIRNAAGTAVWYTKTNGNTGAYLKVRNDAYFVIYNAAGTTFLWSSKQ